MVPEGSIVNAMKVAPSQQVMLRVRFLEVARSASREIGVNWFGANNAGNQGFATGLGAASAGRPAVGPSPQVRLRDPPCVDASANPVARGTWSSDIQYFGRLWPLRSLVRLRCLLASR